MSQVINGDCLEEMKKLPVNSVDTVITDPPYGLEFMGKGWDKGVPGAEYWAEALRVAKPGAMLLAFGGTRTYHRLAAAIEDAGWELRDCMMWLYGSGFPKSLDISKAIDKAKGAEREITQVGQTKAPEYAGKFDQAGSDERERRDVPAPDLAREWNGWGTALKPAWEPIIVAMKPLDGTFAENAEKWGVAGINVDGGRIGTRENEPQHRPPSASGIGNGKACYGTRDGQAATYTQGRWPANLVLDEEAAVALDTQTSANVSRFFYCPKASKEERNKGCEGLPEKRTGDFRKGGAGNERSEENYSHMQNFHPTVKPIKLMEYLCTITKTPTGGVVLDPFAGSGTTGVAAQNTGREFVLIEKEPKYYEICQSRLLPD